MPSLPLLKALGLNFSPNQLEVAPGSLVEASNIIIRRDDVIESRRGFALYGTALGTSSDRCKQLLTYKNKLIRHFSNRLQFENGLNNSGVTSFFDFNEIVSGSPVTATIEEARSGLRMRAIEANSNLYFTSSEGIRKISAKSSDAFAASNITKAGGVKALDAEAYLNSTIGDQSSFLPADAGVAYKIVWGTKDANNNLILGTPSDPVTILNPLLDLTLKDFSNFLLQLDNTSYAGSSLISDTNYYSTLSLPITASSVELRDKLILLAKKLDEDLLFAQNGGAGTAYNPLNLTSASVSSGVATINFTIPGGGIAPSAYFITSDPINVLNLTSGGVAIDGLNTNQIITSVSATSISFIAKDYSITNPRGVSGVITNIPANATVGPTNITITSTNHGLKSSQNITISGTGGINGTYTVTSLTPDTFSIPVTGPITAENKGIWDIVVDGVATAKIESYNFRDLPLPEEQSIPATNAQLLSVQGYYSAILSLLQEFISARGNNIVTSTVYASYLEPLNYTSASSVTLKITIPPDVLDYTAINNPYFYQIYRTSIAIVTDVSNISALSIIQEYTQIEEKFPSASELSLGVVTFLDNTPESIAGTGANLYTNERSGEGGLQANDLPPFALDINSFRGYNFFSNTSTRQRKTLTLIGVVNMINNYVATNPHKIMFTDGQNTDIYSFVKGQKEITQLTCAAGSTLASTGISNYFFLNSANDQIEYYVWYQVGTSTDPFASSTTKTGIKVSILSGDSANVVAQKTANAINNVISSFTATSNLAVVTINNIEEGTATDASFSQTFLPTAVNITSDVITINNHGLLENTPVVFTSTLTVPAPLVSGTTYFIKNATANTFQVSLTAGGGAIDLTTTGTGVLTVKTLPNGFSISVTQQGIGEDASSKKVLLSSDASVGIAIEETAKSLVRVINKNTSGFVNVFYISGGDTTPGTILIETRGLSPDEFYVLGSNSIIGESFNPSISPSSNTITNIQVIDPINFPQIVTFTTASAHGLLNGEKVVITNSNPNPSAPVTSVDGAHNIIWKSATTFDVDFLVPITGTGITANFEAAEESEISSNESQPHRIYYSKYQQPESVPITNFIDVGATDKQILRIFPLRDSLFIFKEDGLFRLSGESAPFSVALFDSSCILIAPDSLSVANNQLYGWTTQGISTITEAGVNIISRPIDTEILKKASSQYTNFKTATWGVGYESDNSYTVYTTNDVTDVYGTIGFRYSNLTNSWTTVDKTTTCGIVNPLDDKLYLGAGDTNYLEKERKEFTRYDYADREISASLGSGSIVGDTLTLSSVSGISAGDVVVQDQTLTTYEFNLLLEKLDNDPPFSKTFSPSDVNIITNVITINSHGFIENDPVVLSSAGTLPDPLISENKYFIKNATTNDFQLSFIAGGSPIDLTSTGSGTITINRGYKNYYSTLSAQTGDNLRSKLVALATKLDSDLPSSGYSSLIASTTGSILTASVANPTVITTSTPHGLQSGRYVTISGNSQTDVNGVFPVTPIFPSVSIVAANVNIGTDVITVNNHGLLANQAVTFTTTGTLPSPLVAGTVYYLINVTANTFQLSLTSGGPGIIDLTTTGTGTQTATVKNTFTIPVDLLVAGVGGNFVSNDDSFDDLKICYNLIINKLNTDPNVTFTNYRLLDNSTLQEAIITAVKSTEKKLTLNLSLEFIQGPITIYKAIPCKFTYSPLTLGDPLGLKHMREATMMFANKAFTSANLKISTDLLPEFIYIPFNGDGNGIFGHQNFGSGFFGGASNSAPFRTFIPRQCQRCRFINLGFEHRIAREQYAIYGSTLTGEVGQSTRAYR